MTSCFVNCFYISFPNIRIFLQKIHQMQMVTGSYFLSITLISLLLSFLPLITPFGTVGILDDGKSREAVLNSMKSPVWRYSLVASILVSVPMAIDFVIDVIHRIRTTPEKLFHLVPQMILIYSLMIPNMLILVVSIPMGYVELTTICLFMSKLIVLLYGIMGNVWFVDDIFQSKIFIFANLLFVIAVVMVCYDTMNTKEAGLLFWLGFFIGIVGASVLMKISYDWYCILRNAGFSKMTITQLSATVYLVNFFIVAISIVTTGIIFRGNYNTEFYTMNTYFEAAFTVSLSVYQSRVSRYELKTKEVCWLDI